MRPAASRRAGARVIGRKQPPKPPPGVADPDRIFGLDLADAPETMDAPEPPPWRLVPPPDCEEEPTGSPDSGLGRDRSRTTAAPKPDEDAPDAPRDFPDTA